MGIIQSNKRNTKTINISEEIKNEISEIVKQQDLLFSALGFLVSEYEIKKNNVLHDIEIQNNKINEIYKNLNSKFGKGKINFENWIYELQKGE